MVVHVSTTNLAATTTAPALIEERLAAAALLDAAPPLQTETLGGLANPSPHVQAATAATATPPYARISGTQPKRGRPLPRGPIRAYTERTTPLRMVLTGPDFVGCSSVLQGLRSLGHRTWQLAPKPACSDRTTFQPGYFDALVAAWLALPPGGPALLIEDSPWAYLTRMAASIAPDYRVALRSRLAPLQLPTLTFVLHTSGRQVGLRHSHHRHDADVYAPVALAQMQALALHMDPCFHLDATPAVPQVVARVERLLAQRIFHVQTAFDGLEHLSSAAHPLGPSAATTFARGLGLATWATDAVGLGRLERLARVAQLNPAIVNPALPAGVRALYWQVLHDRVGAFALDLADLREPARTAPCTITTFGPPAARPPMRLSPAHSEFVDQELHTLREAGMVAMQPTPWAAACFPVPKPRSTKLRLVIDYRALNAQTVRDSMPIPHVRDVIAKIGRCHAWSKVDLKSGFWQIEMDPESAPKTGCVTPTGLYVWKRMPMGIRNGPPTF